MAHEEEEARRRRRTSSKPVHAHMFMALIFGWRLHDKNKNAFTIQPKLYASCDTLVPNGKDEYSLSMLANGNAYK